MSLFGIVILIIAVIYYSYQLRQNFLYKKYGKYLKLYNKNAFNTIKEDETKDSLILIRLADEIESSGGKKGVAMLSYDRYGGTPIHEINNNGTFSARSPYFISRNNISWKRTGKRHLVKTLVSKNFYGFKTSNQHPGVTKEIGLAILEYNTNKYPPITLSDFNYMYKAAKKDIELEKLLLSRVKGEPVTYQGSPFNLKFLLGRW